MLHSFKKKKIDLSLQIFSHVDYVVDMLYIHNSFFFIQ